MGRLDKIDRRILSILEENGRATYVEIARQIGLSQTPCTERIRRLERDGFIVNYSARLNPNLIGRGFTVFVQITFSDSTNKTFDTFADAVLDMPEVVECYMVAGSVDCMLKICVNDMNEFRKLLIDKISNIPGIAHTNSLTAIEVVKSGQTLMGQDKCVK